MVRPSAIEVRYYLLLTTWKECEQEFLLPVLIYTEGESDNRHKLEKCILAITLTSFEPVGCPRVCGYV